ncbi:hypothetical protein [Paenibacillus sp. MBLB4367]|uniref:hypothetical protein n=1 Tax=Paenibacillus sp. MBLB4367 TaxID=3384767 RepID=UPI003908320D
MEKAILNAPDDYPNLEIGKGVRKPIVILSHISFVLTCAHSVFHHYDQIEELEIGTWEEEINRFYKIVGILDKAIAMGLPDREKIAEKLLQGPLSDVMTHIGQLALLRRMADAPIHKENFFEANITAQDHAS